MQQSCCCRCGCGRCGAPALVGFAGKRQWMELLNVGKKGRAKVARIDTGPQTLRPQVGEPLACLAAAFRLRINIYIYIYIYYI